MYLDNTNNCNNCKISNGSISMDRVVFFSFLEREIDNEMDSIRLKAYSRIEINKGLREKKLMSSFKQ